MVPLLGSMTAMPMTRLRVRNHRNANSTPAATVAEAILAALSRSTVDYHASPPLVSIGERTDRPSWLSDLLGESSIAIPPEHPVDNAAVVLVELPQVSGNRREDSSVARDRLSVALEQGYCSLVPGGLLVLHPGEEEPGARAWSRNQSLPTVDDVGIALFRAGFVDPRFISSSDGRLFVLARRGLDLPPTERPQVLSVVLPVYNERATFETVMGELLLKAIPDIEIEIIVVESNSSDGTRDVVVGFKDHPRVTLVLEDRPRGKGHAVRAGLDRARGDIVLIQDADLEYSLDDYENLLDPIRRFETSFVLGRRTNPTGSWGVRHFEAQQLASRFMNVGHIAFAALFNACYRQHLKDPFTMYKVFRRDCIADMVLECDRFDFDWELTAKLIRAGYSPMEIPVKYHSRSFSEGKKVRVLGDPWSWIVACARYRRAPVYKNESATYGTESLRLPSTSFQESASSTTAQSEGVDSFRGPSTA